MKYRLQLFGFDQSTYERPNQKWVCGWASEGALCHRGPDAHGRCCGGFACEPIQNGARWSCSRTAAAGGPCAQGPMPDGSCCQAIVHCRPVRSLRAKRGLVVAWTFALVLGILMLGAAHWERFFSPGPVSSAHAAVLANRAACAACHTAAHSGMTGLNRGPGDDSALCLKCHQSEAQFHSQAMAMRPHGLPASILGAQDISISRPSGVSSLALASLASSASARQVACSTCHHEHRGADGKLASMDNQTCQACHAVKFHSLKDGHPEFTWRREAAPRPILFSHTTHRDQHFANEKFACAACHVQSQDGRVRTFSFDAACARCHSIHFNGEAEPSKSGVVFLQIPALDLQTLSTLKVNIGQWPKFDGDPPVRLAPLMRVLLGGDNAIFLAHLPPDLGQLADAKDDQIQAVQQLAWAIKSLLNDARKDIAALRPALSRASSGAISNQQFVEMTAGLSTSDIQAAADRWFPQLSSEIQQPVRPWMPSERPKAKEASPPPGNVPATTPAPASDDLFNDAAPAAGPASPATRKIIPDTAAHAKPDTAASPSKPSGPAKSGSSDDDLFNGDTSAAPAPPKPTSDPAIQPSKAPPAPPAPAVTFSPNGWERDDEKFALIYFPTGHANRFLRQWIESGAARADSAAVSRPLSPSTVEACTKCHNSAPSATTFVWSSDLAAPRRDFVKFSHTPHLNAQMQSCEACHAFPVSSDPPTAVDQISGFKLMQKQLCAACHAPHVASDNCLTCHNYHVTPPAGDGVLLQAKSTLSKETVSR